MSHTVVFWEALIKDTTWQLCAKARPTPFLKVLLQLTWGDLCPLYTQRWGKGLRKDLNQKNFACELAKKVLFMLAVQK